MSKYVSNKFKPTQTEIWIQTACSHFYQLKAKQNYVNLNGFDSGPFWILGTQGHTEKPGKYSKLKYVHILHENKNDGWNNLAMIR